STNHLFILGLPEDRCSRQEIQMSKPNLSVAIEPLVGSSIVYEPVAPKEAGGKPQGVLCLRLAITNHESKSIHMNKVTVAFASPPAVPTATILVPANWYPPDGSGVDI